MPIDSKPIHTKLTGSNASILPVTASSVGFDLTTSSYVYYNPNTDTWIAAPVSTGSAGISATGTGQLAGLFLTETSSSVTIAVNTYTEVLRLPFTVNSSGSSVKLTFTAGYGKTTTATVFAQVLLDGAIITSSAGQAVAVRKSSTGGFAETIMMATVFTASVGVHTASLQMKTDAGSFSIPSAYGDGTQDWGRLILEVVTTGSSGSVGGSTTLQSSSIGYGDPTNLLTGSLNFRYNDNANRVVLTDAVGSGSIFIGTSSSVSFGTKSGIGLAYGSIIYSLPSNGSSFKNLIGWQSFNGDADTVTIGDSSSNQSLLFNGGSALLLSGSGNILSSSRNIFSGSGIFIHGLSGSHQRLNDGTPAFVAGPNIAITTQSNGAIAISNSLVVTSASYSTYYPWNDADGWTLTSGSFGGTTTIFSGTLRFINPANVGSGAIGQAAGRDSSDIVSPTNYRIYFRIANFVSGNANSYLGFSSYSNQSLTAVGWYMSARGDGALSAGTYGTGGAVAGTSTAGILNLTGSAWLRADINGGRIAIYYANNTSTGSSPPALRDWKYFRLYDIASVIATGDGNYVTDRFTLYFEQYATAPASAVTASVDDFYAENLGLGFVSSSVAGTGNGAQTNTTRLKIGSYKNTSLTTADDCGGTYYVPTEHLTTSGTLRAIVSTITSSATVTVQLFNATSQSYVHIGGAGITTLSTTASSPTLLTSSNLLTATNFNTSSAAIYEVQIYGSGSFPTSILFGAELVFT